MASRLATALRRRGETLAIAETSSGGLASAALLAITGASAFYVGGAVLYSSKARGALMGVTTDDLGTIRPETEPYAHLLAERIRVQLGTTWGLGESGAAGPGPSPYGDAAGHVCVSVAGPRQINRTLETGATTRDLNMEKFAIALLSLLEEALEEDDASA